MLSLMLGAKTVAYYGQKTAANEVFSTSDFMVWIKNYIVGSKVAKLTKGAVVG